MKSATDFRLRSHSTDETIEIGRALGGVLKPGALVGLTGELGSGKTRLAKGVALGLGVADERTVTSPTFKLVNRYEGSVPVFHVDVYRLSSAFETDDLMIEESLDAGGVVLVEWAERIGNVVSGWSIRIEIEILNENERVLAFSVLSDYYDKPLKEAFASFSVEDD